MNALLARRVVQTKLTVGAADDPYEREADRVASQVMRANTSGNVSRQEDEPTARRSITPLVQRESQREQAVDTPSAGSFDAGTDVERQLSTSGGGAPLPAKLRSELEPRFGTDFSNVRVHTGSQSDQLNRKLGAQAFTHGSNIYMGAGKYSPGTASGKHLLAHELTHVVQQTGAPSQGLQAKRADGLIQRSIFTKARVALFGRKEGKTLEDVINPTNSNSKVFKQFMAGQNAANELKFLRDLKRLLNANPTIATIDPFLTQWDNRLPGLRYYDNRGRPGTDDKETQIHQFARLRKDRAIGIDGTWLRNALAEVIRNARQKVEVAVHAYNTAHNRQAAAGAGGWAGPGDAGAFATKDVAPTPYVTANLSAPATVLGQGGVNTVYKHEYNGEEGPQVFKEDQDYDVASGLHPGTAEGIPQENPEFAKRSVAMYRLAQALHSDVISKTAFAVSDGRFGTVQEMAKGKSFDKLTQEEKEKLQSDPNFQSAFSKMQMIDIIAGQMDRHQGNYFVQLDTVTGDFVALKGIDLDLAFGKNTQAASGKFKAGTLGAGNKQIKKFDKQFAEMLIALDPSVIRTAMHGLLSDEEIAATVNRFTQLRDYLREVKAGTKAGQELTDYTT